MYNEIALASFALIRVDQIVPLVKLVTDQWSVMSILQSIISANLKASPLIFSAWANSSMPSGFSNVNMLEFKSTLLKFEGIFWACKNVENAVNTRKIYFIVGMLRL